MGCKRDTPPPGPSPSPPAAENKRADTDVKPAFDGVPKQVDPGAQALCDALHALPAERKAACCKKGAEVNFAGECARVLSLALEAKTVTLGDPAPCVKEMTALHAGCGWVGPNAVELPASCRGVVRGNVTRLESCRSTLECGSGLRCLGAGPTSAGKCALPGTTGMSCELSVDVMATYTRAQLAPHLECDGFCQRHRCEDVLTDGGACTLDAQCPAGQRCAGTCVAGASGAAGAKCVPGGCEAGLRCVEGGCAAPRAEGEACSKDLECLGACVSGKCGAGC